MKYAPHKHFCTNREKGCTETWMCNSDPEVDEDDNKHCPIEDVECDECRDAQCEDCGCYPNLNEPHEASCEMREDYHAV